jgi:ABC-type multidrug transport system permease subunit
VQTVDASPLIPLVLFPSIFLSGILTRGVDQLPRWGQVVSYLIPLRYASDIIQGLITNKTLSGEAGTLVALLVYGALLLGLATLTLREYD